MSYLEEAKAAGADFGLTLPPSYWVATMTKPVIREFYIKVSSQSPLPLIIYNFPGVTAGIDLDSDLINDLARTCNNIVGVKLTCGNVGKLQRISEANPAAEFAPFAGKADFLLPGLVAGSNGVISALANVVPRTHGEVLRLYDAGKLREAQKLQDKLSEADWQLSKLGISGVKGVTKLFFGYGSARARAPLPTVEVEGLADGARKSLQIVVELERQLGSVGPKKASRL